MAGNGGDNDGLVSPHDRDPSEGLAARLADRFADRFADRLAANLVNNGSL